MSLTDALHRRLDQQAQRLDRLALRLSRPGSLVHSARQDVFALEARMRQVVPQRLLAERHHCATAAQRLPQALSQRLAQADRALALQASRLNLLDPRRTLERGYAWVEGADGLAVTGVARLQPGQALAVHLADGVAQTTVQQVTPTHPVKPTDSAG